MIASMSNLMSIRMTKAATLAIHFIPVSLMILDISVHIFFKLPSRESAQMNPMQELALVTAYEALEMASFVPHRTSSSSLNAVETFYDQISDDY